MCLAIPRPPPYFGKRASTRKQKRLMMAACVLDILENEEAGIIPRGRMFGSKNIRRTRKDVDSMWSELNGDARKAWRMSMDAFDLLHETLEDDLKKEFKVGTRARGESPNGEIPTKLRLSAAIRFFAGGAVYDIMLTHGMCRQSVYKSVYGVVDCVNREKSLSFNMNNAEFPSHEEQREIAKGFYKKSAADFDKVMMAIDGMLVWTIHPSRADCEFIEIGERMFHCYRKDKFGFVLMAGCDHETKFRWADIRHPAVTSDYLAWTSSGVGSKLQEDDCSIVLPGYCIAGDNAFVENMSMATPIPGVHISEIEDAHNFYLSQLRITIERAFGILVHRWGVLRRPLSMSILKVPAIVTCLMRLHNFCIDYDSRRTVRATDRDERNIRNLAARVRKDPKTNQSPTAVFLDKNGVPKDLMGSGHHFRDEPGGTGHRPASKKDGRTPMRRMMKQVADLDLRRPNIN